MVREEYVVKCIIRFSLLTGVTKFSKVSIFSDLNNLNDISRDKRYYDICGISQSELETVLQPYIQAFADSNNCSVNETNDAFRRMYDGYRFTSSKQQNIYNPFSVLSALDRGEHLITSSNCSSAIITRSPT